MNNMKTVELSGVIKFDSGSHDDFDKIKLVQKDGYKIDLVSRVAEMIDSFGQTGQVNYWISEKPKTKEQMIEKFLQSLYGSIEAKYEKTEHYYSTLTGGDTFYETELTIGGHNLHNELQEKDGMYLVIEFSFNQYKKAKA
jgi:hypothetical protein